MRPVLYEAFRREPEIATTLITSAMLFVNQCCKCCKCDVICELCCDLEEKGMDIYRNANEWYG